MAEKERNRNLSRFGDSRIYVDRGNGKLYEDNCESLEKTGSTWRKVK